MNTPPHTIRRLRALEEYQACVRLQKETWGEDFGELVPPALLMAVNRIGGVAAGAFAGGGDLVGFVFGMTGIEDGRPVHWSDMLAVRPDMRNAGIGERLKRYQREQLLPLGVETVYWTFDPLESKNAYINFTRLGAVAGEYHRNLYGETDSALHRGIGTDRFVVAWPIAGDRVDRCLRGEASVPTSEEIATVPLVNATGTGPDGLRSETPDLALSAPRIRVAIPADIQSLKDRSPRLAADWRQKTRVIFTRYFDRGYRAVSAVRDGDRTHYLLERV